MRIGEGRLLAKREQRWQKAYDPFDPTLRELAQREREDTRRAVRWGVVGALIGHVVLFLVVFPTFDLDSEANDVRRPRVYKLQKVVFEAPKPQVRRSIPKPKARRIPIPDPTPDDPEPIVRDEDDLDEDMPEFEFPAMDASAVWVPDAPPGPAIGPVRVEGDVLAPKRVFAPQPEYPEEARLGRVQGVVILETIIDTLGAVTNVKVLKGLPSGLTEAAVKAVSDWRFNPAMLNGEPVAVYYLVTVSFSVQ